MFLKVINKNAMNNPNTDSAKRKLDLSQESLTPLEKKQKVVEQQSSTVTPLDQFKGTAAVPLSLQLIQAQAMLHLLNQRNALLELQNANKENLIQKLRSGETKGLPCRFPKCGEIFCFKAQLEQHVKENHEDGLMCDYCGHVSYDRSNHTVHKRTHTGEKPHQCPSCEKRFPTTAALNKHIRTHTGEKPYQCTKCTRAFGTQSGLIRHGKVHTGEKPYQCSECGKAYTRKEHLKTHMRNHTGEKPFRCECGKAYQLKTSLRTHIKKFEKSSTPGHRASSTTTCLSAEAVQPSSTSCTPPTLSTCTSSPSEHTEITHSPHTPIAPSALPPSQVDVCQLALAKPLPSVVTVSTPLQAAADSQSSASHTCKHTRTHNFVLTTPPNFPVPYA